MSPQLKFGIKAAKSKFENAKRALDAYDHILKKLECSPLGEIFLLTITGYAIDVFLRKEPRSKLDEMARLAAEELGLEPQAFAALVEFQIAAFELARWTGTRPIDGWLV